MLALGVGAFLAIVVFRGTPNAFTDTLSNKPAQLYHPDKKVPLSKEEVALARQFIKTAVERRDLNAAYTIVHPDLKGTLTRKQWDTGNIPVVSYPARERGHGSVQRRLQLQDLGAARGRPRREARQGPAPAPALLPRAQARGREAERPLARELLAAALEASGAAGRRLSEPSRATARATREPTGGSTHSASCRHRWSCSTGAELDRGAEVAVHRAVGDRRRLQLQARHFDARVRRSTARPSTTTSTGAPIRRESPPPDRSCRCGRRATRGPLPPQRRRGTHSARRRPAGAARAGSGDDRPVGWAAPARRPAGGGSARCASSAKELAGSGSRRRCRSRRADSKVESMPSSRSEIAWRERSQRAGVTPSSTPPGRRS